MKKNHLLSSFLTGIVLLATISYLFVNNLNVSLNSDVLSMLHLLKDLVWQKGHLSDWYFSPSPFFFPEFLLFAFWGIFTKSLILVYFLCYVTLLLIYYHLVVSIGILASGKQYKNLFRLSALFSLLLAGGHLSDQEIFTTVLMSHFSILVVMYLASLFFILKLLEEPSKKTFCVALGILCALCIYSDPLFFFLFVGSIAPALLVIKIERKKLIIKYFSILLFIGVLTLLSNMHDWFHLHIGHSGSHFYFDSARLFKIREAFALYYADNPIPMLAMISFFLIGNTLFIDSLFSKKTRQNHENSNGNHANQKRLFVLIAITASISVFLCIRFFLDRNLMVEGYFGLRYYQQLIVLPLFLGLPILFAQLKSSDSLFDKYYFYFLASIVICLVLFRPFFIPSHIVPVTECLDRYYSEGQLAGRNGISDYWNAGKNSIFSKEKLNIVAVKPNLKAMDWISSRANYRNKTFNFVLLTNPESDVSAKTVLAKLGAPQKKLVCPNAPGYQIYVYNEGFKISKD